MRTVCMRKLNNLRVIFQKNGYPNLFISNIIKKFQKLKTNTNKKEKRKNEFLFTIAFLILEKIFIYFLRGLNC